MNTAKRFTLAALSGGLFIACFPYPDISWLAYVALIPLIYVCYKSSPGSGFLAGWFAGTVFFGGLCYWVGIYGIIPFLLMAVGIGLLFGVTAAAVSLISVSLKKILPERFLWFSRPAAVALVWVALEIIRSETGVYSFPYGTAGLSQHSYGPVVALAAVAGVYGVSYLVVLVNALGAEMWLARDKNGLRRPATIAIATISVFAIAIVAGTLIKNSQLETASSYRISIVQPSIPQNEKWLITKRRSTMARYEKLINQAARSRPDLIVLPEAALPAYVFDDDPLYSEMAGWARRNGTPILAGVPLLTDSGAYNTVRLFDKQGKTKGSYAKIIPTLFGELVPFRPVSELLYPPLKNIGDIRRGTSQTVFRFAPRFGKGVKKFGVLICSESLYSRLALDLSDSQAESVFVLTNDAWFFSTNEATLHFNASVFRAVETGLPIAQVANNGVSGIIDASGRVSAKTRMNEITTVSGRLKTRSSKTVYARFGNLLLIGIVVTSALMMACLCLVNNCTNRKEAVIISLRKFLFHKHTN